METVKGPDSRAERLEGMVRAYQLSLLRLCVMYLRDEDLARDAVQETFLRAYRSMDRFRGDASEKTWLTRIAINCCKDLRRSAWFRHVDQSVTLDALADQADPTESAERDLTLAILRLPVKLREAALLCWLQGMSSEEAAAALGISRQAVGSRLNRARQKLRNELEGRDHA